MIKTIRDRQATKHDEACRVPYLDVRVVLLKEEDCLVQIPR
jgi:hypothetical protein